MESRTPCVRNSLFHHDSKSIATLFPFTSQSSSASNHHFYHYRRRVFVRYRRRRVFVFSRNDCFLVPRRIGNEERRIITGRKRSSVRGMACEERGRSNCFPDNGNRDWSSSRSFSACLSCLPGNCSYCISNENRDNRACFPRFWKNLSFQSFLSLSLSLCKLTWFVLITNKG